MINVLTDVIQGLAICILTAWCILNAQAIRHKAQPIITQEPYKEPEPICGCTHHQCFHDENGCGQITTYFNYASSLNERTERDVKCGCKRYTGPEPLPQVIP